MALRRPQVPIVEEQETNNAGERYSRMLNYHRESQQIVKPKDIDEPQPG